MINNNTLKRVFISSYVGNTLETYDFVLCGILAAKMSQVFFPCESAFSSLLLMLSAYAVGFVSRPIGAVFFGYIGDIKGRKVALFYSLFGMSICTLICGLLPSYEMIGVSASVLFFMIRIMQGICIGGESQGGSIFVVEHFWKKSPAAFGAFFATSNGFGALLATFVSLSFLTIDSQNPHIWRYPFILGAVVGLIGFYIRKHIPETPAFKDREIISNPLRASFQDNKKNCFRVFLYVALISSITQFGFTFVNIYLSTFVKISKTQSLSFACLGTLLAMSGVATTGLFLKKFPDKVDSVIKCGVWASLVLSPLVMVVMQKGQDIHIYYALILLAIFTGLLCGAAPYFIAIHFKHSNRYSGSALINNLAQGFVGGFFPSIGLALLNITDLVMAPGIYISILSLLFIGFNHFSKDIKLHEKG